MTGGENHEQASVWAIDIVARSLGGEGKEFPVSLRIGLQEAGIIRVRVLRRGRHFVAILRWNLHGGDEVQQRLEVVHIRCRDGAERSFLRCPLCEKRRVKLLLVPAAADTLKRLAIPYAFLCKNCCPARRGD